jgi:phenylalanyl-tRNA synthetase beta chain
VYLPRPDQELPDEPRRLGIAMSGPRHRGHWTGSSDELLDFYDLKGVVETLLQRLRVADVAFAVAQHPTFQNGRAAKLTVGENEIGFLGEVHPLVREQFGLPAQRVCLLELDLEAVLAQIPAVYHYQQVSRYPTGTRDLALIVPEDLPAVQVRDAIFKFGGKLLKKVELFDLYRGEPIPAGKKSLAYTLTYQTMDRTLTDEEINRIQTRIQKQLKVQLGIELRT